MLLENRTIAVTERLNTNVENLSWGMWKRAMLSRTMMNLAGAGVKNKLVNTLFKDTWAHSRGALEFAPKSFNKRWKEENP